MNINDLLIFSTNAGASDLHLSSGSSPMVRVHGRMRRINLPQKLSDEDIQKMILSALNEEQLEKFKRVKEVDFSKEIKGVARFRVNVFQQIRGIAGVFRTIPEEIRTFEELGLPDVLKSLCLKEKGLILLTGPTGSGKSTTLATMVDHINENRECHIITIEDPVEFFHHSKTSLINQREVGDSTHSFSNALRVALREDPDVILVGEMRDLETISLALTAAETGHLVLATLHTSSAAKTIDRIIDIFPKEQQSQVRSMLSESLEAVLSQKLLPTKDGNSRVVACELLITTTAVRNLIREEKIYQIPSVIQAGSKMGMQTLDHDLSRLVMEGKIDRMEAAQRADNPKLFDTAGMF
ncbi:MAG: twitching motility protein PilT [Candidatus Cloacimonetes bacterium 4572_55]|nr:MAG: twitching motility protein PilT [Candidatus Cloacimonetes bacterium 4572_55]